ncbi:MAG: hypothetical protein HPY44_18145 [Armatimonadetes bacterium]|nr:hypothetical protein [Armatimonadota bacterium]
MSRGPKSHLPFPILPLFAALCGPVLPALAQPDSLVEVAALGVQLVLPGGWVIAREVDDRGVSLVRPGSDDPVLEIIAWTPVADELSAHAAARAHEQVLAAGGTYQRIDEEIISAPGGSALLVRGSLDTGTDGEWTALFAAYLLDGRYYVLGTFVQPARVSDVRTRLFDAAARSFSLIGTSIPSQPEELVQPAGSAGPVPPAGPVVEDPALPATDPAAPPVSVTNRSIPPLADTRPMAPIRIKAPEGWLVREDRGCIFVEPSERPRPWGACVWPVVKSESAPLERRAVSVCRDWAQLMGARWRNVRTRLDSAGVPCAVCQGSLRVDGQPVLALAVVVPHDAFDTLYVVYFTPGATEAQRVALCAIPASFRADPVHTLGTGAQGDERWVATDGALESDGLPGWLVSGGVRIYNGLPAIDIMGLQPRTGARFSWRQPEIPMYRDLSPALAAAGWREGSDFPPDQGTEPLLLWKRTDVVEACANRAKGGSGLNVQVSGEAPNAARMLEGAQGSFARASGQGIDASCLCALAPAPKVLGADCWMVASLRYEAPSGSHNDAGAALRRLIDAVRVRPYWPATTEQRRALEAMIAGVREAAQDLPEGSREMTGGIERWPLLTGIVPADIDGATSVEIPPGDSLPWARVVDAQSAREQLPELLETW